MFAVKSIKTIWLKCKQHPKMKTIQKDATLSCSITGNCFNWKISIGIPFGDEWQQQISKIPNFMTQSSNFYGCLTCIVQHLPIAWHEFRNSSANQQVSGGIFPCFECISSCMLRQTNRNNTKWMAVCNRFCLWFQTGFENNKRADIF